MTDVFRKEVRSKIMASIRSKHTAPELVVKKSLRGLGFSYQPKMKGSPDFVHNEKKIALFVNGCFWHGCTLCSKTPKSNAAYWLPKIKRNVERDEQNRQYLQIHGYRVITIWEHQLKNRMAQKRLRTLVM